MNAKMCDRCGNFYTIDSTTGFGFSCTNVNRLYLAKFISNTEKNKTMDLCSECKHDLDDWFNKFKKEEQNDECTKV